MNSQLYAAGLSSTARPAEAGMGPPIEPSSPGMLQYERHPFLKDTGGKSELNAAILALEDGTVFEGKSFGAPKDSTGEVVFNTAITGYQEIFTDPSYAGQIVVFTTPKMVNSVTTVSNKEAPNTLF